MCSLGISWTWREILAPLTGRLCNSGPRSCCLPSVRWLQERRGLRATRPTLSLPHRARQDLGAATSARDTPCLAIIAPQLDNIKTHYRELITKEFKFKPPPVRTTYQWGEKGSVFLEKEYHIFLCLISESHFLNGATVCYSQPLPYQWEKWNLQMKTTELTLFLSTHGSEAAEVSRMRSPRASFWKRAPSAGRLLNVTGLVCKPRVLSVPKSLLMPPQRDGEDTLWSDRSCLGKLRRVTGT